MNAMKYLYKKGKLTRLDMYLYIYNSCKTYEQKYHCQQWVHRTSPELYLDFIYRVRL